MSDEPTTEDQTGSESEEASEERAAEHQAEVERAAEEQEIGIEPAAEEQEIRAEPSAEAQELMPEPGAPEVGGEARFGRFLRLLLRWAVGLLLVFALGVVAMQFARVQPLREEVSTLNQSLAEAEAAHAELQVEVNRLEGVDAENEALSDALLAAEAKLALLDILVDVSRAQLALAQEDPVRVAAALRGTGEKLSSLRDLLGATELEGLRERLVLVLSEVDSDPFAAERDLEILANTLLEIERELSEE